MIPHKLEDSGVDLCMGVATKVCVTIPPPPTISLDFGDIMNGMRLGKLSIKKNILFMEFSIMIRPPPLVMEKKHFYDA